MQSNLLSFNTLALINGIRQRDPLMLRRLDSWKRRLEKSIPNIIAYLKIKYGYCSPVASMTVIGGGTDNLRISSIHQLGGLVAGRPSSWEA